MRRERIACGFGVARQFRGNRNKAVNRNGTASDMDVSCAGPRVASNAAKLEKQTLFKLPCV